MNCNKFTAMSPNAARDAPKPACGGKLLDFRVELPADSKIFPFE